MGDIIGGKGNVVVRQDRRTKEEGGGWRRRGWGRRGMREKIEKGR